MNISKKEYDKQRWLRIRHTVDHNKIKVQNKEWRLNNVTKTLYLSAKRRARLKQLDFNLELSDIIVPEYCPILQLYLHPNQDGSRSSKNNSPSLDRIDNRKGYIKGNVQVISTLANIMKSNATKEQLKMFAKWVNTYVD